MTNARICIAVFIYRENDWMIDEVNCSGNFEPGFMICARADRHILHCSLDDVS